MKHRGLSKKRGWKARTGGGKKGKDAPQSAFSESWQAKKTEEGRTT